jgi:hypothetical protein
MAPIQLPNPGGLTYCDAHLTIDFGRRAVMLESRPVELTSKEFAMLALLAAHAGEILSREAMLSAVWGYSEQTRLARWMCTWRASARNSAHWGTGISKPCSVRDAVFSRKRPPP